VGRSNCVTVGTVVALVRVVTVPTVTDNGGDSRIAVTVVIFFRTFFLQRTESQVKYCTAH
jgi:hypothetical protein